MFFLFSSLHFFLIIIMKILKNGFIFTLYENIKANTHTMAKESILNDKSIAF